MEGKTLEQLVRERLERGEKLYSVLKSLYQDIAGGRMRLIDPSPPRSLREYLLRLDYSLWLWAVVALVALTHASVALSGAAPPAKPLRYVAGSIYVLFIPGYVLVEALYPEEGSLTPLERLALSIGLSLAVIPLIGLVLNYTPWGIRLKPIMAATTVYVAAMLAAAAYRKYRLVRLEAEARGRSR
ncbi:hypothetical protein CF15_08215 [Pyrodictium occultum]|uniref:DUF1616 domain-containing protein n=1 Tax=Pyrodictium occultum TaxID=2309 RepID=A0A0V8RRU3_PYROC|nr:DUF1616 domain-containing protein [Pyrodictium occultum]KSW10756.1 hypothetical protein CF15_08215 [Pyrodictium occultum]